MVVKTRPTKFVLPDESRKLWACFGCKLVKSEKQFLKDHCENCLHFEAYDIQDYTTENFGSLVFIADPKQSWFSKQLGLVTVTPGAYTLHLRGEPSEAIKEHILELQDELN